MTSNEDPFTPPEPEGLPLGKYRVTAVGSDVLITLEGMPKQSIKLSDLNSLYWQKEIAKRLKVKEEQVAEVAALLVAARAEKEKQKPQTDSSEHTPTIDKILSEAAKTQPPTTIHPSQDYKGGVGLTYMTTFWASSAHVLLTSIGEFVVIKGAVEPKAERAPTRLVIDPTIRLGLQFPHVQNELAATTRLLREKKDNGGLLEIVQNTLKVTHTLLRGYVWYEDKRLYLLDACWILGTYMYRMFSVYPYQNIAGSPGAGKSRNSLLKACMAFKGEMVINPKETYLFRSPNQHRGTQILDEDVLKSIPKEMMGSVLAIARAGYKAGAKVPRCASAEKDYEIETFEVYCPRVFSGIRGLEDALNTRALKIVMEKLPPDVKLVKEPDLLSPEFVEWRTGAYITALYYAEAIKRAYDSLPSLEGASGREIELTQPLIAICSICFPDQLEELKALLTDMSAEARIMNFTDEVEKMILRKLILSTKTQYLLKEIVKMLVEDYPDGEKPKWLNRNRVSSAMDNLKITKRKGSTSAGIIYYIDLDRVKKKADLLGVTSEDADNEKVDLQACAEYVKEYFSKYPNTNEFWDMHERAMIRELGERLHASEETARRVIADYRKAAGK